MEIASAAEDVVVELGQEARTAGDQPTRLVGRIARRIGIGLVLLLYGVGHETLMTTLPVVLRDSRACMACGTSLSAKLPETCGFSLPCS